MAIFKCKMCGGTLEIPEGTAVAECEYCGSKQTVPLGNDEVVTNLFNRANNLRLKSEFDKAAEIYGKILNTDDKISEAHWGLVLCKYGIEYVEDPKTYRRIPTCHRTQYVSVLSDADYLAAIENADAVSRELYIAQAHEIAELQRSILAIVKDEKPFDVFICYKETDENGRRTLDSTLANDIYYQLTREGLRVFYSAITLENKLGIEYEPYIFAALNSARVMLVIGTKPEYFTSVWMKNEWSRYLGIMKNNREKLLIPCYRDMDAYDLPEEFAHLQAQDMSKIGFINDLVRGIKKVTAKDEPKVEAVIKETVINEGTGNTVPLLKRAFMFLEDGEWVSADEYAEKVLDLEPECAEAYLVKLMGDLKCNERRRLKDYNLPFNTNNNYQKVIRFGTPELKAELEGYIKHINEQNRLRKEREKQENKEADYEKACNMLAQSDFKKWEEKVNPLQEALAIFRSLNGWKDSAEKITLCEEKLEKAREALERKAEEEQKAREKAMADKKRQKRNLTIVGIVAVVVAMYLFYVKVTVPLNNYKDACKLMDEGKYSEAITAFENLGDYSDSSEKIKECNYRNAFNLRDEEKYVEAAIAFGKLGDYKDAKEKSMELWDKVAVRNTLSAKDDYTVAVKNDGTVVATGDNSYGACNVSGWNNIISVSAGGWLANAGLKSNGTVVSTKWGASSDSDIVSVSSGGLFAVVLKSDGTVVVISGRRCDTSSWTDIIAVSAGFQHVVGLKSDGTVVSAFIDLYDEDFDYGQCNVSSWTDIVAVSAGESHTVGVKSDGTVVAVGYNDSGQCDVSLWRDIVSVSAGYFHTVGLKSDGTVVAVGSNYDGKCDVESWKNIVAVSTGTWHTVGLKSDGTVVAVGENNKGQCDVSSWTDIKLP